MVVNLPILLLSIPLVVKAGPTIPFGFGGVGHRPSRNLQCSTVPAQQFARDLTGLGLPPVSRSTPFRTVRDLCSHAPLPCQAMEGRRESIAASLPRYDDLVAQSRVETNKFEIHIFSSNDSPLPDHPQLTALVHRFELVTPADLRASIPVLPLPHNARNLKPEDQAFLLRLQKYCLSASQLFLNQPARDKSFLLRLAKCCMSNPYDSLYVTVVEDFDRRLLAYCTEKCLCVESKEDQIDRLREIVALQNELAGIDGGLPLGTSTPSTPDNGDGDGGGEKGGGKQGGDSKGPPSSDGRQRQCNSQSSHEDGVCRGRQPETLRKCGDSCSGPAGQFCDDDLDGCKCVQVTPIIRQMIGYKGLVTGAICLVTKQVGPGAWGIPRRIGQLPSGLGGRDLGYVEVECMCNATVASVGCCTNQATMLLE